MQMQQQVPTSLVERAFALISSDVLTITALLLLALLWSWAWTQWRKPMIKSRSLDWQASRIRLEAFITATAVAAILIITFGPGGLYPRAVIALLMAPLAGLVSPLGFDVVVLWIVPALRRRFDRWANGGGSA